MFPGQLKAFINTKHYPQSANDSKYRDVDGIHMLSLLILANSNHEVSGKQLLKAKGTVLMPNVDFKIVLHLRYAFSIFTAELLVLYSVHLISQALE